MPFSPLPEILADLRAGKMVVLTDDENRENEGDLILPVAAVTPERITWMLQHALGYMCLSLTEADCDRLQLHPQGNLNTSARGTAFTVSIDLHPRHGGTTGVSAKERARCIQMAADPAFGPDDFVRPGHINPLRSRDGGVLVRTGQTEGSLDLCRLAGLYPAAVIIEIMKPDGEMARVPDLVEFCKSHGLKMCSVAQIIEHRLARESLVRRAEPVEGRRLRTALGEFDALVFQSAVDPLPHLVLSVGGVGLPDPADVATPAAFRRALPSTQPTLVRMHRRNLMGDVFGDFESTPDGPSGEVLRASMRMIQAAGRGAIVYLRTTTPHAPAGTDLESVLQTFVTPHGLGGPGSPPAGPDPNAVPMPQREFGIGGQILRQLGLTKLRLITGSHRAMPGLEAFGLEIVERVPPV